MKTIKLANSWRNRVNATTVHEYPAGWSGDVSNETAERAAAAKVLDGRALDADHGKPAPKEPTSPATGEASKGAA